MERSEIPHDPRHLGVPPGVSKIISEPMVRSTQTGHLSCTTSNEAQVEAHFGPFEDSANLHAR